MPQEISRVTKFIIKRGATVDIKLTSDHYRSSLVEGGLEIKCKDTVKVPNATPRQVTECYCALFEELYVEPKGEEILSLSILVNDSENMDEDFSIHQRSTRPRKQPSKKNETTPKSKDITAFFNKERNVVACACTEKKIIVTLIFKFESLKKGILMFFFANMSHLKNY